MNGRDLSLAIEQQRGRQRIQPPIEVSGFRIAQNDAIVDLHVLDVRLHHVPTILVHGNAQHGEAPILKLLFNLDEPGDLDLARPAPGGPEIEQHDFAFVIAQVDGFAVGILESKVRRRFAILLRFDGRFNRMGVRAASPGGSTSQDSDENC